VRAIRLAKGISQEELAERLSMGQYYVSGLEKGARNPTTLTLALMADALGVAIGELFATDIQHRKTVGGRRPRRSNTKR